MGTQVIDVRGTTGAPPGAVWALLSDSATWPSWTGIDTHAPERPGGPDGVGERRIFRTGRRTIREEIVERRTDRRLSYTLLTGLALRDYRADIDLAPRPDGGTDIRWHTTFVPKVPGTGRLYRKPLLEATEAFVDGLARRSASGSDGA